MKKLLALLLCALLLPLGFILPADRASAEVEEDLWAQIEQLENKRFAEKGLSPADAKVEAFAELSGDVEAIVEGWSGYVPGSLSRNGDTLIWDGADGTGYGYFPRFRKILRSKNMTDANPADGEGVEVVSFTSRGGASGSADVTLFGPYYGLDSSFTNQYKEEAKSIAEAVGGTYTCIQKYDVNIDAIADALETSGVVIFDSHGSTDYSSGNDYTSRANTSYLCINSGTGVTAEDMATVQGPYGNFKHALNAGGGSYFIDGTAIANHMEDTAPNSFLWMAICLGMATDGMEASLHAKGIEVVYGYSQSVTFSGDYRWEDYFWTKMKGGSDVAEAIAYMKEKGGIKDPYTNVYPAYPIVVSTEDDYPGHGNVDKAQQVYSSWTLFPQFAVTAVANDDRLGTVEVSGTSIIATPKTGCAVKGYELLSGTARVTQNGDGLSRTVFSIRAESDCAVRIIFAEREPVKATFVTPAGVSCSDINGYTGDTITLPMPTGKPTATGQSYGFYGWSEVRVDNSDTRPDCLRAGDQLVLTENRTFYALYSYATQNGAPVPVGTFLLLITEPADWSGETVLTYDTKSVLSADCSSSQLSTSDAAVRIGSTGITVAGDALTDVPNEYIYVIEPAAGGNYTIRMKNSGLYLCYMASADKLAATKSVVVSGGKSAAYWALSWEKGKPVFTNNQTSSATLCFDTEKGCFNCKKNNTGAPLTVYTVSDSSLYYTTELNGSTPLPPTPPTPPVELTATVEWNAEDVSFKGKTPYVVANGKAQTPRFTVTAEDGSVVDPADYDYEYLENTNAGTAYLNVTFKNAFTGTAQGWFKIYLPATDYTAVENRDDGIYMEWNAVPGAAGYVIYRRAWSTTTNGWTDFARWNNTTDTFYTDGLDDAHRVYAGTRYQYGVKAYFEQRVDPVSGATIGGNVGDNYNLGEVGPLKTTVRITTRVLNSVTGESNRITAKWAGSNKFTGYELQLATDEAFTADVQTIRITNAKTYETAVDNLRSDTTYYVRIRSYHEFEGMTYFGGWSNVLSAKTK